jgi:serine/threonine protein kinase
MPNTSQGFMNGQTLARFQILDRLGEGGTGVAYRAMDLRLRRVAALMTLTPAQPASKEMRARLLREARSAAVLNLPNIYIIYDISQEDGFTSREHVEESTLKDRPSGGPVG